MPSDSEPFPWSGGGAPARGALPFPHPSPRPKALPSSRDRSQAPSSRSRAQALGDYGRTEDAHAESARAALAEEQATCLLGAAGCETEAGLHRMSAASCLSRLESAHP